jgi:hypothetical protein
MAALTGLTLIKRFTYRGVSTEEFANQYHFTGTVPADATAWRALFDAMVTAEKPVYPSSVTVVRGYGYATDNPDDPNVWTVDLTVSPETPVAGTCTTTSSSLAPGDAAVWVRWKTSRLNSRGKPIYLRKYFHPALFITAGVSDTIQPTQKTNLNTLGTKLFDASFIDGRTIRSMSHAETIVSRQACDFITTRTLKRRGRRPTG